MEIDWIADARRLLLHGLSVPFCTRCWQISAEHALLCVACREEISPVASFELAVTAKKSMVVHAVGEYTDPLASLVRAKQRSDRLSAVYMGELLADTYAGRGWQADLLVPVPLHWSRMMRRGYNQASLIAEVVGRRHQIPVYDLLRRSVATEYQASCSAEERVSNVAGAFVLNKQGNKDSAYAQMRIALIDDVMTTGATLRAAGSVLFGLRPLSVQAFVIARAP